MEIPKNITISEKLNLPPRLKQALILSSAGHNGPEIAKILGIRDSSARRLFSGNSRPGLEDPTSKGLYGVAEEMFGTRPKKRKDMLEMFSDYIEET